jgi:hypothetical protein
MAKLTSKARNALPKKEFALGGGRYPIEDKNHARNALARVAQHGSPGEKAQVKAKVHAKYPAIGQKKTPEGKELERRLGAKDKR